MTGTLELLLAVGVVTGVTTVLFGFGGGFITVPAVYLIAAGAGNGDGGMHTAVATSTAVMIVNAGSATLASARRGLLDREYLWPIVLFIAAGAVAGACAATLVSGKLLHWLFVVYIAVTIADCLMRRGFVTRTTKPVPLSIIQATVGGTGIGAIASFLGVGGSVLTVPLLRRRGVDMAGATAMANPLSLPVAIFGSAVYALAGPAYAIPGDLGHINLIATAVLLAGSLPTIAVLKHVLDGRVIPDRAHAVVYIVLLVVVLAVMVVNH